LKRRSDGRRRNSSALPDTQYGRIHKTRGLVVAGLPSHSGGLADEPRRLLIDGLECLLISNLRCLLSNDPWQLISNPRSPLSFSLTR